MLLCSIVLRCPDRKGPFVFIGLKRSYCTSVAHVNCRLAVCVSVSISELTTHSGSFYYFLFFFISSLKVDEVDP